MWYNSPVYDSVSCNNEDAGVGLRLTAKCFEQMTPYLEASMKTCNPMPDIGCTKSPTSLFRLTWRTFEASTREHCMLHLCYHETIMCFQLEYWYLPEMKKGNVDTSDDTSQGSVSYPNCWAGIGRPRGRRCCILWALICLRFRLG